MIERRVPHAIIASAMAVLCLLLYTSDHRLQANTIESTTGSWLQNPAETKTASQVYKNIQVLNDLPASELDGVMNFMSASLGVGCNYCHTNPWDSDVKSAKSAARRMILMVRAINKEHFSNNPAVTCYSCHRGQHNTTPNPPVDFALEPPDADAAAISLKTESLPPTEEIIDKYLRAIAGAAAIANLKTLVSTGSETTSNRMGPPVKSGIEIYQTTENKLLIERKSERGIAIEGVDGTSGWVKDARGQREISGRELIQTKREADFLRYLNIKNAYPQMRVLAKEKIAGREVYVVGATSRDDVREKLYFDLKSGLLVRQSTAYKTAFGTIPEVMDFDDYREVNGMKLPFSIVWSRPPFGFTRKFAEIKLNVALNPEKFHPPAR